MPLATREGAYTSTWQRVQEGSAAGDENRRGQQATADTNEAPDGLRTASAVQHLGKEVGKLTACNVKKVQGRGDTYRLLMRETLCRVLRLRGATASNKPLRWGERTGQNVANPMTG